MWLYSTTATASLGNGLRIHSLITGNKNLETSSKQPTRNNQHLRRKTGCGIAPNKVEVKIRISTKQNVSQIDYLDLFRESVMV